MTPSQQKFLFVLVRDALRSESDQIEAKRYASKHIPALRLLGYLNGDELTKLAYQELFSTFELLSCPTKVQYMADSFGESRKGSSKTSWIGLATDAAIGI